MVFLGFVLLADAKIACAGHQGARFAPAGTALVMCRESMSW